MDRILACLDWELRAVHWCERGKQGKSWTISDYLRGNTASHYRWARNRIRKWLAKLD